MHHFLARAGRRAVPGWLVLVTGGGVGVAGGGAPSLAAMAVGRTPAGVALAAFSTSAGGAAEGGLGGTRIWARCGG